MNNLFHALSCFDINTHFDEHESHETLIESIDTNLIDLNGLKCEYINALNSTEFDWLKIAQDANLFSKHKCYSNIEIKFHVMTRLHDWILPEQVTPDAILDSAAREAECILEKNAKLNNDWIPGLDLYSQLRQISTYASLNMHDIEKIYLLMQNIEIRTERFNRQLALGACRKSV